MLVGSVSAQPLGKGKYGTICLPFAPDATTLQHYAYNADRQELNRITKTLNVTPFRAYLTLPATADVSKVRVRIVTRGESTSIDNGQLTMDNAASGAVYDLQGRRVTHPAKGIYIVNGRKVVIK